MKVGVCDLNNGPYITRHITWMSALQMSSMKCQKALTQMTTDSLKGYLGVHPALQIQGNTFS